MKIKRKLAQLITALIYNCHLKGFLNGSIYKGRTKGICTPGLNCYSCPGAVAACPLGSLQGAISRSRYSFPFYILGMLLLFGVVLGRTICGFLCPFGLFQEILYKLPTPKIKKSGFTRKLSYLKYVVLIVFVILIPVLAMDPGFCKYICPVTVFLKPMSYFSLLRIKCDKTKCIDCGRCKKVCPMDVDVIDNSRKRKNATECILCFECVKNCPKGALH